MAKFVDLLYIFSLFAKVQTQRKHNSAWVKKIGYLFATTDANTAYLNQLNKSLGDALYILQPYFILHIIIHIISASTFSLHSPNMHAHTPFPGCECQGVVSPEVILTPLSLALSCCRCYSKQCYASQILQHQLLRLSPLFPCTLRTK